LRCRKIGDIIFYSIFSNKNIFPEGILESKIKATVKIFGLSHSSALKKEEIYPAINEVCPPESVLVVMPDSSVEVCNGNNFHSIGDSPILIEIFSSNPALLQFIGKRLLVCKSAKRFTVRAQLCIDIEP